MYMLVYRQATLARDHDFMSNSMHKCNIRQSIVYSPSMQDVYPGVCALLQNTSRLC